MMAATLLSSILPDELSDSVAEWEQTAARLDNAGYGQRLARNYRAASLKIAEALNWQAVIDLADIVSLVAIKASPSVADRLCASAIDMPKFCKNDPLQFNRCLELFSQFCTHAPESLTYFLLNLKTLCQRLDIDGLEAFVWGGFRSFATDVTGRAEFFKLRSGQAHKLIARQEGRQCFSDFKEEMCAYVHALYGLDIKLKDYLPANFDPSDYRPTFSYDLVRLPIIYPASDNFDLRQLYRASLAHIGAHIKFTNSRFERGSFRPIQIAVASIIEDARVEQLAIADMPGARKLWLPFHDQGQSDIPTVKNMFACLSRALLDPDFTSNIGWVCKAQDMFFASECEWNSPVLSRRLGNLLGNDLGQMRVQFNHKDYVVGPIYRDDNMGLWDFDDRSLAPNPEIHQQDIEAAKRKKPEPSDQPPLNPAAQEEKGDIKTTRLIASKDDKSEVVAQYHEFDFQINAIREDWVSIRNYDVKSGQANRWQTLLEKNKTLVDKVTSLQSSRKIGRQQKLKRQLDGDALDLDASVRAAIDLKLDQLPELGIYERRTIPVSELAINIIIDVSHSTSENVVDGSQDGHRYSTILDREIEAVSVLSQAMETTGDMFAISAFCSDGRDDVRFFPIKEFDEKLDEQAGQQLAGLKSGLSTRLGAAIRHAGQQLAPIQAERRVVLLLSDSEPSDIDCTDPEYLIQDARRAISELSMKGIDIFCVGFVGSGSEQNDKVFEHRNFYPVQKFEELPEKLASIYLNLAR